MLIIPKSGLYIVTLNNSHPISVNAQDPRMADKAIKVTSANCKFGKAKVLENREKNYFKTFGEENVNFSPIVAMENIAEAEKIILVELDAFRIRGRTGRKNEWLEGISATKVKKIIMECLDKANFLFTRL